MILRLQSVEELELLQSRIKAKAKSTKVHINELRTNTGANLNAAPQTPKDYQRASDTAVQSLDDDLRAESAIAQSAVAAPDAPRKPQKCARATFEHQLLGRQLTQAGIAFREEFRFEPRRRWRFDFLVDNYGIEIDGGLWIRGRHSRGAGQLGDMEKQNHAALLGFHILRFSPDQVKSGEAIGFIEQATKKAAL